MWQQGYNKETLLTTIEKLAVKKTNVIRLCQAMPTTSQAYNESITTYAKWLGKAAVACDFISTATCLSCNHVFQQSYMNEEIRDAFFCGLYDKEMLEKLCMQFQDTIPNLHEIVTSAESIEASRTSAAHPAEATVSAISTYKKNMKAEQRKPAEPRPESTIKCYNCSETGHIGHNCRKPNKYKGYHCKNCGKVNHHESQCRQKTAPTPTATPPPQNGSTNSISQFDGFIFQTSSADELKSVPRVSVKVSLQDHDISSKDGPRAVTVKALADTGASHCVISEKTWRDMRCNSEHLSP